MISRLHKSTPRDTAGLKWAPVIGPAIRIIAKTVKTTATGFPADILSAKSIKAVPINS